MATISQIYEEGHPSRLRDGDKLWRYVPLRTLLLYLNGSVFIPSVELLRHDDPFEGAFHFDVVWFNSALRGRFRSRAAVIEKWLHEEICTASERRDMEVNKNYPNYASRIFQDHYFEFLRKTRFAWCWFRSESESAAMWKTYGAQGVAVATNVGKLRGMLEKGKRDASFGNMRYVRLISGEVRDFSMENERDRSFLLRPHFLKRHEYRSEEEVRFVFAGPDLAANGIVLDGMTASEWIEDIRFWPGLKSSEEQAMKQTVSLFTSDIPCGCSDLFGADEYRPEGFVETVSRRLDDLFETNWTNNKDGVPDELKQL